MNDILRFFALTCLGLLIELRYLEEYAVNYNEDIIYFLVLAFCTMRHMYMDDGA